MLIIYKQRSGGLSYFSIYLYMTSKWCVQSGYSVVYNPWRVCSMRHSSYLLKTSLYRLHWIFLCKQMIKMKEQMRKGMPMCIAYIAKQYSILAKRQKQSLLMGFTLFPELFHGSLQIPFQTICSDESGHELAHEAINSLAQRQISSLVIINLLTCQMISQFKERYRFNQFHEFLQQF